MIGGALRALALLAGALVAAPAPVMAQPLCAGRDLIAAMAPDDRAALDAAVAQVPYHHGLLWQARRGDARITLLGTYHFADPRHQAMLDRLAPALADAAALMVEAGPDEQARLIEAMAADPTLVVDAQGPTLPERLDPAEWQTLSQAMAERGSPAIMTARLRPWYVALMLGISPCMMRVMAEGHPGLDEMLIETAQAADLPVIALEPWDTALTLFADMTPAQELDMIRLSLPAAVHADDYGATLTNAYFAGDVWRIWEFGRIDALASSGLTRAQVDEQMEFAQTRLMENRNRAWIAPIEAEADKAAARGQGVVVGFGALHLPGEAGVLRLLEQRGWQIVPLPR